MSVCHTPRKRGENLKNVLAVLKRARKPLSAYEILSALRDKGITSPPTVYRALERLVANGQIHRLESLNAFVACHQPHGEGDVSIFTICDDCGAVEEICVPELEACLKTAARGTNFRPGHSLIEMHGHCRHCSGSGE